MWLKVPSRVDPSQEKHCHPSGQEVGLTHHGASCPALEAPMHDTGYFVPEEAGISALTGREMGSQGDRGWIQVTERRKDMGC